MGARFGILVGLAAVCLAAMVVWIAGDRTQGTAEVGELPSEAGAEVARPGEAVVQTVEDRSESAGRVDVYAAIESTGPEPSAESAGSGGELAGGRARDTGLGGAVAAATSTERFAQEIAANLGWSALGPYEATQLGAEAAQFASAKQAALSALAEGSTDGHRWAALTRSAEGLARDWIERFGPTRGAQLVEYMGLTAFDPATGEPRPLDLGGLGASRREL